MNVFQNSGIGLGSNFNRRRTRDARDSGGSGNGSSTIVAITDKQTKSLLRERDAKIAALEKEVLTLKNKISGLSSNTNNHSMLMVGQRTGKKGLTPYGNTVRVSTSKCSDKRRQVSDFAAVCFSLNSSSSESFSLVSSSPNAPEWAAMPPSPPKPFSTPYPTKPHPKRHSSNESKTCSVVRTNMLPI